MAKDSQKAIGLALAAGGAFLALRGSSSGDGGGGGGGQTKQADFTITSQDGLRVVVDASPTQGDVRRYEWGWGDGTGITTKGPGETQAVHDYAQGGTFTVTLTVIFMDGTGDSVQKTVNTTAVSPSASLTASRNGLEVTATASGSSDPQGDIVEYAWNWGDGTTETTTQATNSHVYASEGTFTVTVSVVDAQGNTDLAETTVSPSNSAPSASINYSTSGLELTATASGSSDPDANISHYEWDFGDGTGIHTTQDPTVQYTYASGGTYTVTVTVLDAFGAGDAAQTTVSVASPGTAPQASLSLSTGQLQDATRVNVSASDAESSTSELSAVMEWFVNGTHTYTDGPGPISDFADFSMGWSVIQADDGDHIEATLTVTDPDGKSTTVTDSKTALQPGNDDGGTDNGGSGDDGGGDTGQSFENVLEVGPIDRTGQVDSVPFNMGTSGEVTVSPGTTPEDYTNGTVGGQVSMTLEVGQTYEIKYNGSIDGIEWSNTSLVCVHNGQRVDPYSLADGAGPRNQWFGGDGSDVIEATFRVTEDLYAAHGQAPARAAAEWIGGALELRGVSYDLLYDFEPVSVPTERAVCFSSFDTDGNVTDDPCRLGGCDSLSCCTPAASAPSAMIWWNAIFNDEQGAQNRIDAFNEYWGTNWRAEGEHFTSRKDSNLLLTNADSGGCAFVGGNLGSVGAGRVNGEKAYDPQPTPDTYEDGIWAIMHEFGHNLGYSHPKDKCGNNVGGSCENGSETNNLIDGYWYATPCNASQKAAPCTNRCGQLNPKRVDTVRMNRMYYTPCTIDIFREHTGSSQGQMAQSYSTSRGFTDDCTIAGCDDPEGLSLSLSLGDSPSGCEGCGGDCGCDDVGGTGHSHDTVSF